MAKEFIIRKEGRFWYGRGGLDEYMRNVKDGEKIKIVVSRADKRSLDQNSYYWQMLSLYVQPALKELGWSEIKTKEDAHDFLRDMFLKNIQINEKTGEERNRIRSTTELTKAEFSEYLEEIFRWAAEYLSITIPAPNEQFELEYFQ